jgi:hypothetical protein
VFEAVKDSTVVENYNVWEGRRVKQNHSIQPG